MKTITANSGGWGTVGRKTVDIHLEPGRNSIRLSNPSNWMPDIDYIELKNNTPTAIQAPSATQAADGIAYDLSGRPATDDSRIKIINGKKYLTR